MATKIQIGAETLEDMYAQLVPVDRVVVWRLAELLGTDRITARDWLVAKVAAFRGIGECDIALAYAPETDNTP